MMNSILSLIFYLNRVVLLQKSQEYMLHNKDIASNKLLLKKVCLILEGWTRIRSVTKMIRLSRKMPFSAKMLPSHWSNHFIRKNEMIIVKMKYFIGKMLLSNQIAIIPSKKIFRYVQLYTYTLTGKMKFNENNEKFQRKNGLDKWNRDYSHFP